MVSTGIIILGIFFMNLVLWKLKDRKDEKAESDGSQSVQQIQK
jgi:hypothetical protein